MTIICVKCQIELRPQKAGEAVESMRAAGPYQVRMADRYACPSCGIEIVTGLGSPIAEHFELKAYPYAIEQYKPQVRYWLNAREKALYEAEAAHA